MIREPLAIPLRDARAPLVLTLDVGTSGTRSWIFDGRARPIRGCTFAAASVLRVTPEGEASLDAAELTRAACALIDRTLAAAGRRSAEIAAVAMCTFWHSLLGVDAAGRPATRVLTWADTRARDEALALRRELDAAAVHARTGANLHASYWPAKLRYLRETPAGHASTSRWLSFSEYMQLRLFGRTRSGHGMASATGLYDQRARAWDEPLLAELRLTRSSLPEISDEPQSDLKPAFARRWPSLAGKPWFPAIGDGAGSNVGSGAVGRETAALFLGTSGAVRVLYASEDPPVVAGGWTYHLDARHLVVGGALSNGGNVVSWLASTFPSIDPATLWRRGARASDLTALPLLAGDRSPTWDDGARAAIAGLSLATSPADIARAMLEGVAHRVARLWSAVDQAVPGIRTVIATGGTLLGRPWLLQLFADAIDRPLVASGAGEGSARGAAIVALVRLGALSGLDAARSPRGRVYLPRSEAHARLAEGVERQRRLELAVAPLRSRRTTSATRR